MYILHVITTIDIGGAENQLLLLAGQQVKQAKKVSVLYLKGSGDLKDKFESVGVNVICELSNKNLFYQVKNLKKIIEKKWDVIHCHLPRAEVLTYFAGNSNTPVVTTRHFGGEFYPGTGKIVSRFISRLFTRNVACIIGISESVKTYLINSREIKNTPIQVVDYAFSKSEFLGAHKKSKPDIENPIIGVVSRLSKEKRVDLAIEIFANFLQVSPRAKLHICGEGNQLNYLQKKVKKLGVQDEVEFLGKIRDIQSHYSNFDLLLHTSEFEGFGLVYIEAMCFGLPIVYLSESGFSVSLKNIYGTKLVKNFNDPTQTNSELLNALKSDSKKIDHEYGKVLDKYSPQIMESKISKIYELSLQQES